ncbi:type IV secretory system conjugative DNA transfer family protein [Amycolatopsis sp. NPDC051903]|uniref:type IV secretory system conjugative DNA transfer family protein n=1 Tax=Amycolatopsis sp. NPDC051903 TaxID=3363936 RepID=UPI0037AAFE33
MTQFGPIWLVAGLVVFVAFAWCAAWLAAQAAAAGTGFHVPGFGGSLLAMKHAGLAGFIGPQGTTWLFWLVFVLLMLALAVAVGLIANAVNARRNRDGRDRMASAQNIPALNEDAARAAGVRLRPSLDPTTERSIDVREVAQYLGDVGGTDVYRSLEDVLLAIFGPRSNKTSAVIVPAILSAVGHCVATSNKPDVYALTHRQRAAVGEVFAMDVAKVAYAPQDWWYNPFAVVRGLDEARIVSAAIMREVGDPNRMSDETKFWWLSGRDLLARLILAAAGSGRTMRDVRSWAAAASDEPIDLLDEMDPNQYPDAANAAEQLRATYQRLAPETRQSIEGNVRGALSSFESEQMIRWVTPPETWVGVKPAGPIRELRVWDMVSPPGRKDRGQRGPITLYLLSKESESTGRPIMTLLVDQLLSAAQQAATAQGGRLDPPMTLALDEAANVLRIDLPALYTYAGSIGLLLLAVLQSREQGREAFGRAGFESVFNAANQVLVGAGIRDPDFAEHLSRLVGPHLVGRTSITSSRGGGSESYSEHWEQIMRPDEIAAMPKTHALLLTQEARPAWLRLHPWYSEPEAAEITANSAHATQEITRAALEHLGPDNPLVTALQGGQGAASQQGAGRG